MKDILHPIGTIVEVENTAEELERYVIIGRRMINPFSMKSWDYISVPYETGLKRVFNTNGRFDYDDFFYFNHYDIKRLIKE